MAHKAENKWNGNGVLLSIYEKNIIQVMFFCGFAPLLRLMIECNVFTFVIENQNNTDTVVCV